MRNHIIVTALTLALTCSTIACRGKSTAQQAVNPPAPTPGSPYPGDVVQSLNDAIAKATNILAGGSGSARFGAANVTALMYIQTTGGQAGALVGQSVDPSQVNSPAWLFVENGKFQNLGLHGATPTPAVQTLWVLAISGYTALNTGITDQPINLASLGVPVAIPPGQIPAVDAVRAPLSIAVGTPSLVSGKVQVPINAGNPFNASLVPYTGFNIHLRWDAAVFTLSSANNTGSVLPSSFCLTSVTQDTDGAGVILSCASTGSQTTATGLLATIVLTPAASGCSNLHLFTYVGRDHGDTTTGTYVINAFSNQPLPVQDVDGRANVSGGLC